MTGSGYNCDACDASRQAVKIKAGKEGASSHCFAQMSISALPILVGECIIAYLWTGQVFAPGVREAGFGRFEKMLHKAGAGVEEIGHFRQL